ncbi:MAG: hypothetical protein PHW04_02545 [Candidatus Wallbacteria bacterium]|nr:hypothetical protein [Candidatus Wallbacteria bacterium]
MYFLFFLIAAPLAAMAAEVNFYFSTQEIELGKPLELILEIRHSGDEVLTATPEISGSPEVFATALEPVTQTINNIVLEKRPFSIQFFGVGKLELYPIRLEFSESREIIIPTQEITVKGVISPDETIEIMDIKPPLQVPIHSSRIWRMLLILLLIFLIIFAAYWLGRKFRRGGDDPYETLRDSRLSPYDEARAALQKAFNLLTLGKYTLLYFQLSEILRRYFGRTYGLNLMEMTTTEAVEALSEDIPGEIRQDLQQALSSWDLIKYAKAEVEKPQAAADYEQVKLLIEKNQTSVEARNRNDSV